MTSDVELDGGGPDAHRTGSASTIGSSVGDGVTEIAMGQITIGQRLGKGTYGEVHSASWNDRCAASRSVPTYQRQTDKKSPCRKPCSYFLRSSSQGLPAEIVIACSPTHLGVSDRWRLQRQRPVLPQLNPAPW